MSSTPTVTYRIDFYASDECDPTGHGEGEEFLGYTQATADAEGNLTAPIELEPQSANSFYTATATDGDGNTSEFGPCNGPSAPVAADDAYTTPLDTPLVVEEPGVLANDTDAENDHTIAQLVTQPTNGTVELAPDGSFTYTATPGFTGEATFTYRAADETGVSEPATVMITVEQGPTAVTVQTFSIASAPALPWSGMILLALAGSVLAARAWRVRR